MSEWVKKAKGAAKIYTHPEATEGCAIVQNHHGIFFAGQEYKTLDEAKAAALGDQGDSIQAAIDADNGGKP